VLSAISCVSELSGGKPRSLQPGALTAEGFLGGCPVLAHSTWAWDHQDYFEILTMVDSERLPGCRDLRACMCPRVRRTAVTAPQFENTTRNHSPLRWKPRLALILQV